MVQHHGTPIEETSSKTIDLTFKVNAIAHLYTIKEFLPDMIDNRRGHVVSICSISGMLGVAGMAPYSSSKFAAFGIDEVLR